MNNEVENERLSTITGQKVDLFFELIWVAVGNADRLSRIPSASEWRVLFELAGKQALTGVCLAGVERCIGEGQGVNMPLPLKLQWIAIGERIKAQNGLLDDRAREVTRLFLEGGFQSVVLKGQGLARLYDCAGAGLALRAYRQSGDIDLWVDGKREEVIGFMARMGWTLGGTVVHHTDVEIFEDAATEIHHYPSYAYSPFRWRKYRAWFREEAKGQFGEVDASVGFRIPSLDFNLVYVLLHIYRHVFHEGIGLRQLMDYYFVLLHSAEADRRRAMRTLRWFGLGRFAAAVMYVEQEVFGLKGGCLLCEPDEDAGRFLLDEIMRAGNFGQYDSRIREAHSGGGLHLYVYNVLRLLRMLRFYPSEVLWAPVWKVGHYAWRWARGYK